MEVDGKSVLITGRTGSFGRKFVEVVLAESKPDRLIVFSRDELKQFEMQQEFGRVQFPSMRYFIGDVRDRERLYRAFDGVDVVIHAAALKQVPTAEYNPFEVVRTNVLGAQNVIDAAIDRGVSKVVALSTDKAAHPINLYGATKLCADKMFTSSHVYAAYHDNVVGSRGSVVPLFLERRKNGSVPLTDDRMTRFWITTERGVRFVLESLGRMRGDEIFVPKIPSMKLIDLARAIAPDCEIEVIGIRPGEKLHEVMITRDDSRNASEYDDHFAIRPGDYQGDPTAAGEGRQCDEGFEYTSDTNTHWLTLDELRDMVQQF